MSLKDIISATVVLGLIGVWGYQILVTATQPDMILYSYVIIVGMVAAVALFGRGAFNAGMDAFQRLGEQQRQGASPENDD